MSGKSSAVPYDSAWGSVSHVFQGDSHTPGHECSENNELERD